MRTSYQGIKHEKERGYIFQCQIVIIGREACRSVKLYHHDYAMIVTISFTTAGHDGRVEKIMYSGETEWRRVLEWGRSRMLERLWFQSGCDE